MEVPLHRLYAKKTYRNAHTYSRLSGVVYEQGTNARKRALKQHKLRGYKYDKEFSDKHTAVFVHPVTRRVIVAARGTELKKGLGDAIDDLATDALLVTGNLTRSARFRKLDEKLKSLRERYREHKIELTGHSLGGALAVELGKVHQDVDVHAFNAGTGPLDMRSSLEKFMTERNYKESNKRNIHRYHVQTDALSLGNAFETDVILFENRPDVAAHSLENFKLDE